MWQNNSWVQRGNVINWPWCSFLSSNYREPDECTHLLGQFIAVVPNNTLHTGRFALYCSNHMEVYELQEGNWKTIHTIDTAGIYRVGMSDDGQQVVMITASTALELTTVNLTSGGSSSMDLMPIMREMRNLYPSASDPHGMFLSRDGTLFLSYDCYSLKTYAIRSNELVPFAPDIAMQPRCARVFTRLSGDGKTLFARDGNIYRLIENICPINTYSFNGRERCSPCPAGSQAPMKGSTTCVCRLGYYGKNGLFPCTPCPEGSTSPGNRRDSCVPCMGGQETGCLRALGHSNSTLESRIKDLQLDLQSFVRQQKLNNGMQRDKIRALNESIQSLAAEFHNLLP